MATLKRKIMRRIYYAYALRVVSLPGVWQGFAMLAVIIMLTRFVSLGNVLHNLAQNNVSTLGTFTYNAVHTTEAWTLLLIGLFIFSLFSFRISIMPSPREKYQLHHTT